jgi:hypothetical protein
MRWIFKILSKVELMGLVFFCNAILTFIFLKLTAETEITTNIYFLSERFDYLVMSVIGYNIVSKRYHIIVLPAIAITLMRFINECLHLLSIVEINNFYLLSTEFIILLLCLWGTSKTYSLFS